MHAHTAAAVRSFPLMALCVHMQHILSQLPSRVSEASVCVVQHEQLYADQVVGFGSTQQRGVVDLRVHSQ